MAAADRTTEALAADISAVAQGDRQALKRIFDAEAGRLIAIAERIVRRRDLAEDVVQDAFVAIWQKAHQYSPDRGSARGWLHAIVRNRALNILRDGKREDLMDGDALETLQEADQTEVIMSAWTALDSHQRLRRCLEGLEETRRRGILMAYVGGYSHGEIAGRLSLPLGTAKSWIRRGLASLRECMA